METHSAIIYGSNALLGTKGSMMTSMEDNVKKGKEHINKDLESKKKPSLQPASSSSIKSSSANILMSPSHHAHHEAVKDIESQSINVLKRANLKKTDSSKEVLTKFNQTLLNLVHGDSNVGS